MQSGTAFRTRQTQALCFTWAGVLLLCLACSLPGTLWAQTVKLIGSTRQDWSGGIAGRYGSNFTFSIEFSNYRLEPVPDTIWIGQSPIPVLLANTGDLQTNTKRIPGKKSVRFDINVGTSSHDLAGRMPKPDDPVKTITTKSPVAYSGVALLSYRYKRKTRYYTIKSIITNYPAVNYP